MKMNFQLNRIKIFWLHNLIGLKYKILWLAQKIPLFTRITNHGWVRGVRGCRPPTVLIFLWPFLCKMNPTPARMAFCPPYYVLGIWTNDCFIEKIYYLRIRLPKTLLHNSYTIWDNFLGLEIWLNLSFFLCKSRIFYPVEFIWVSESFNKSCHGIIL